MSDKQKTTKVKLAKAHTHAGKPYKVGDSIEVNDADLKWLRDHDLVDDGSAGPALSVVKNDPPKA